jgi:hypothetical protein
MVVEGFDEKWIRVETPCCASAIAENCTNVRKDYAVVRR